MSVPLTLLGLLEREPSHGYELKRDYDAYFGRGKPLPFGQVYATLGRLARDGKVEAGEAEPGAGPDRKRYVITGAGVTVDPNGPPTLTAFDLRTLNVLPGLQSPAAARLANLFGEGV